MKIEKITKIRHSLAHLLAMAVLLKYPETKLAIGPAIDNGFYYDFEFPDGVSPSTDDLKDLQKTMRKLAGKGLTFDEKEITAKEAREMFASQPYKLELISEFVKEGEKLTTYTSGDFTDLCKGGHTESTKEIDPKAFKLTHIAGAYWKGDEKNKMLTRIYGLAFETPKELEEYIAMQEEAKKRDHRKLGKELDLFTFSDVVGKGLPLWTERGATIRRVLERFIVDEEIRRGYKHVITPDIASIELYKKSGHYPYYKDSMYAPIIIDDEEFMLRPMSCPHHYELYLRKPHSYRELPIRYAEIAKLYRYEQSGELSGLIRARAFSLADSHIICTGEKQAKEEIAGALDLIEFAANKFGLSMGKDYWYRLSLGDISDDKKYFKDDNAWKGAENILRDVLKERGADFIEAKKEAAFYGPKIDIQMRNVNGKEDTAFTVQYDFVGAKRFILSYVNNKNKESECVVIHRSSIGAIERIVAFLIEHYAGAFPVWLSPIQVKIIPIADVHNKYAEEIFSKLLNSDIRAEIDLSNETFGKKIREAKIQKTPYFLVIGDEEVSSKTVTVESRDDGKVGAMTVDEFIANIQKETK